ncbi:hypothetical protein [Actinoplanes sp. M2I2]|uniref:hypothetical protein n=1 Tax=Actinoplanes sp. M2I2 TaxID=1734444 RepID=UPI002020F903|nr:hypothetical protein [Actinoplanes sp. M2I2]
MTTTILSDFDAETVEAEFMYDYVSKAPRADGAAVTRIGGGVVLAMRHDGAGYWNKALGFTEPVTADLIDQILAFYREHGVTEAVLQLRPDTLPAGWADICATRGIHDRGGQVAKLAGEIDTVPVRRGAVRTAPVTAADAAEWATVILDTFGFPREGQAEILTGTVGDPRWRPYAAWDTDPATGEQRIVAGGNLYLNGDVAGLTTGATLAAFRNRGAQSALLAARIEAAREAGCRWVTAETAWFEDAPEHSSLNNVQRAGLTLRYVRTNWVWQNPEDGRGGDVRKGSAMTRDESR